jgi:hypothetical protein
LFTFREAGMQVSPVAMSRPSPRITAPSCLPLGIKDSLKEDRRFLLLALGLLAFWCGRLREGKRIAGGKRLLKGKELLKGNH